MAGLVLGWGCLHTGACLCITPHHAQASRGTALWLACSRDMQAWVLMHCRHLATQYDIQEQRHREKTGQDKVVSCATVVPW